MPTGIYPRSKPYPKDHSPIPGRPSDHAPVGAICEWCGEGFFRKPYKGHEALRFCSQEHRNLARPCKGRPRKLPATEIVIEHYVNEGLSLWQIARKYGLKTHKPVEAQLKRAGIPRRKAGRVTSGICKIDGCDKAAVKIKHPINGSLYGTLCAEHREDHYLKLNRAINRRKRGVTPDRFNPWRYKEKSEERTWIRQSKTLLKKVRQASLRALISPGASQLPGAE